MDYNTDIFNEVWEYSPLLDGDDEEQTEWQQMQDDDYRQNMCAYMNREIA